MQQAGSLFYYLWPRSRGEIGRYHFRIFRGEARGMRLNRLSFRSTELP